MFLNVPSPEDTAFHIFHRKLWMTALAFLGPEFIFQISLGQYLSARRSIKAFHESGETRWMMAHGFFADMGYVEFPKLNKENIEDKNKIDMLLRALTLFQILFFLANTAGRQAQNLNITVGELTTVAFVVVSMGTMWCLHHKPAEISIPEIVVSNTSIAEIVLRAENAVDVPYIQTPLDFISRVDFPWSRYWSNWINILRQMGIVFGPQVRPVCRFENTNFLVLPGYTEFIFVFMSMLYSALFICGWNYDFPTRTEQVLWRTASVTMMVTILLRWVITEFAFTLYPKHQKKLDVENGKEAKTAPSADGGWLMKKIRFAAACIRNNSVSKDPGLAVPLKAILPVYLCCFFYCCSRTYLLIADVFQLRSLRPSAYDTVRWLDYVPHF
ncbi:hypothetical protein BJ875DRAFT_511829 [Amylocarpus encephaloides]|uniref:Uncharacterized protein n=1 Tax=Amylocarpus encephaloides TaxID=45428 RepID=A0A9P8C5Z6_9HELO|nr:hypothetical protein BJ875DRAFT_511829 [Amylocarpus encephaloides]